MLAKVLKGAKSAGITAREVYEKMEKSYKETAKGEGWKLSELAATLTDLSFELRRVYGKKATRFLFEDQEKKNVSLLPPGRESGKANEGVS